MPVTAHDIERLVQDGHLGPVGLYRGSRVYAPHHVDELTQDMLDFDALTRVHTQWSDLDEEKLAAETHPMGAPNYLGGGTPKCPQQGRRSYVVDRPDDWARACWHHLAADEQAAIAAERSDIPAKSFEGCRSLVKVRQHRGARSTSVRCRLRIIDALAALGHQVDGTGGRRCSTS